MAFLITKDLITEPSESSYGVGITGPLSAQDETLAKLRNGEGELFRMLDDDNIPYYEGLFIDDGEAEDYEVEVEFQPLSCYGLPASGCTIIEYRNASGNWEAL